MSVARVLIIQPDGSSTVEIIVAKLPQFKVLVGGWIECVTLESCHLYVDEDGKMKGNQPNVAATILAHQLGWPRGDELCGPVVVVGNDPAGGEADVPEDVLDAFNRIAQSTTLRRDTP